MRKQCARCHQHKPADQFNKYRRSLDGLQSYCRDCGRLAAQEGHERQRAERLCEPVAACLATPEDAAAWLQLAAQEALQEAVAAVKPPPDPAVELAAWWEELMEQI
jgi:hypothetical protein